MIGFTAEDSLAKIAVKSWNVKSFVFKKTAKCFKNWNIKTNVHLSQRSAGSFNIRYTDSY